MEQAMNVILTVIEIAGIVVTALTFILYLCGKISQTSCENITDRVKKIVKAMEQIYSEEGRGETKFAVADGILANAYKELSAQQRKTLIESAVYDLNAEKGTEEQ